MGLAIGFGVGGRVDAAVSIGVGSGVSVGIGVNFGGGRGYWCRDRGAFGSRCWFILSACDNDNYHRNAQDNDGAANGGAKSWHRMISEVVKYLLYEVTSEVQVWI